MHFGMTGMIKLRNVHSHLWKMAVIKGFGEARGFRYKDSRIKPDVEVKQEWPQGLQSLIWNWKTMTKTRVCIFRSRRLARVRLLSGLEVSTDEVVEIESFECPRSRYSA